MFGIYFGLGLKSKVFCRKNNRMMEIMDNAKLGTDIVRPKIPQIPKNLWVIVKKRFHRVSVIRAKDDDA
jgi:hypothetical protein